jgi:type IV pilus assembly protein PilM
VSDDSIWKKEISFKRKAKDEQPEEKPAVGDEPTSVWKKEISLKRKPKPEVEPEAEVAKDAVWQERIERAAAEIRQQAEPVPESEPEGSDPQPGPEQTVWKKEVSFSRKPTPAADPEPEQEEPEPVVLGAVPEPEPVAAFEPPAVVQPVVEEDPDTARRASLLASFSRPAGQAPPVEAPTVSVPVPVPAPVVEPVAPAVEAPAPKDEKVPFWKKDISLGGKTKEPKAPKQKKEKQEKRPKERRVKEPKAPKVKAEKGSKGAKRLVGLKIGASQLAAARVANNGSAELLQVAREPLMPGIVVGGELRDPDALVEALKDFFAKHKLPKKGVRLGIANNRIGVRTFEIAGIADPKQLGNAIRFRAQEVLPIPIDEAVLDYQVLGEGVDEQGQPTRRVLLVVAYRELIDRYMEACKKAGVTLSGIDLEAFALLRALQAPQEGVGGDPTAALVAVAIGHERSTFAVSDGRVCEFTRVLEWGGAALNVAIARALNSAPSEVEDVKHALSLTSGAIPDGLDPDQAKRAVDAVRKAIQTFARELVSSLQYYQNQPGSLGIAEIILSGGTAHLPGLAAELEGLIGVRVRVGDPLARMKVSKRVSDAAQVGSLAVAIGLGIED